MSTLEILESILRDLTRFDLDQHCIAGVTFDITADKVYVPTPFFFMIVDLQNSVSFD